MSAYSLTQKSACFLAACFLAGCAPPVQVKDVLANQTGFLDSNFSPVSLPASVQDTVEKADHAPLNFHKMVLQIDWTATLSGSPGTGHAKAELTLANAGGSFVQTLTQYSRNGVPTSQKDSLTYRGLFELRGQSFSMNARNGGLVFVVHVIQHFDPINPAAEHLQYAYTLGLPGQYANFADHRIACQLGKAYPAERVFALFAEQARDIECSTYNSNGALSGMGRFVYLQHYGVAIQLQANGATGIAKGKVVSAIIE